MKPLVLSLLAALPIFPLLAEEAPASPPSAPHLHDTNHPHELGAVEVLGRNEGLVGFADSASEGKVSRERLELRPLARPGELAEAVPGMAAMRHAGGGDANDLFLRGFSLGHGSDFLTSLNGVPLNQPSHAHAHGFSNLNMVIPELVDQVDFNKGPYDAAKGNFASVGAMDLSYGRSLPRGFATVELGSWGYHREVFGAPIALGEEDTLIVGAEHTRDNGPWQVEDGFEKWNGLVRWNRGDAAHGFSVGLLGHHGDWTSTTQVPQRAIDSGLISRFGTLDPTDGGRSARVGIDGEFHHRENGVEFKAQAYAQRTTQQMFFNFTQFAEDPVNGDQREQNDRRWTIGGQTSLGLAQEMGAVHLHQEFGAQFRSDFISTGTYATAARNRLATLRRDDTRETNAALYYKSTVFWNDTFRTTAGLRADFFHFDVDSQSQPLNSGADHALVASPKLGLAVGPFGGTEFYANAGMGFHSNPAQGVMTRVDEGGNPVAPSDPVARQWGAEIGVRTEAVKGWSSALALWALNSESELTYIGEDGVVEPGRKGRRLGVEWTNDCKLTDWLSADGDLSLSRARYDDGDPAGSRIPNAVEAMATVGLMVDVKDGGLKGLFGGINARYVAPAALTEDNAVRSRESLTVNAMAGYRINAHWTVKAQVFNLLNRKNDDIQFYYESQLAGEGAPAAGRVVHPAEPISGRLSVTVTW